VSARLDGAVWAGVERRLAAVERYIPEAPPWVATAEAHVVRAGVRAGPAFGGRTAPGIVRRRFLLALTVAALLLAIAFAVLVVGTAPPSVDRLGEPFGPYGLHRSSDAGSSAVVLPDGRALIVSGEWVEMGERVAPLAILWHPTTGQTATQRTVVGRVGATATLLLDGRVLVTGGFGGPYAYGSSAVASAETWDPGTGAFAPTGSMMRARVGHTATLLADGRVLVMGGVGPDGDVPTAEVWDPASDTFQPAGSFVAIRGIDTATLLEGGDVLAVDDGRAEIWRSATATFKRTEGFTSVAGLSTTATALLDGRILFIAGTDSPALPRILVSADGQVPVPSGSLLKPRNDHAATLLADGRVLITGGRSDVGHELRSVEIWDPRNGSIRTAPPLDRPVAGHAALLLPDGRVLIAFNVVGPNGSEPPFVYDPPPSIE
jgi:hypothetical protein